MEEVKDYVFYTISKDLNDNYFNKDGIAFGVKRGSAIDHHVYFQAFLDIDLDLWKHQGLTLTHDWANSMEVMSAAGNIMIVNAAPEIKEATKREYLIYLPDNPTLFQVNFLESISEELKENYIEIGQFGNSKENFLKQATMPGYDAHTFLEQYIIQHKSNLEELLKNLESSNKAMH